MKDTPSLPNWDTFIQLLLNQLEITSRKDVLEIHARLDKIEKLVSQAHPALTREHTGRTWKRKTAAVIVLNEILRHPKGINFKSIKSITGYDDKKLRNVIYRLDKIGKIKKISRGVYKPI